MPYCRAMKALIVIPTYDERENLPRIVPRILAQDPGIHVLVVDDASPDGTGAVADELAAREPRIRVIHRAGKLGLGSAYVAGFQHALRETDARFVVQMDADLSHDPAAIPALLAEAEHCDVAVGSRYAGGVRVMNWALRRLIFSVSANLYAARVTGVRLADLTSGFKCYRRSVLEALPLDRIHSDGYAFNVEMVVLAAYRGMTIREVPITFTDRVDGKSKLSQRIFWEAAWLVWWLRIRG